MNNSISSTSSNPNYNSSISMTISRPNGLPLKESLSNNMSDNANDNGDVITDMRQKLVLYGYILLFVFGYLGHFSTIVIFLRRTLRSVSTSCLFICVTISNIIYLLVCIYDFLYIGIRLTSVNYQSNSTVSNALCRFRSFIQSVAMCSSAWLLVAISFDRWLRIRYPFKVKQICTTKRVLFGALTILICAITLNSHLLLSTFGSLSLTICLPLSGISYMFFYRQVWGILFACLQTMLPTLILLIMCLDMFIRLRAQQKQKQRLNQGHNRSFVDRQILIIMLTSIFLFFTTQIPFGLFNILLLPVILPRLSQTHALELTSIVAFIASINYATTFYVHCLTSGLFRQEFYNVLHCCLKGRNRHVGIMSTGKAVQTIKGQTLHLTERAAQHMSSVKQ